jgi:hypothetical protein
MPLVDLSLPIDGAPPPGDVRDFLWEADRRLERCQFGCRIPGFVPCDYVQAYWTLRALAASRAAPGRLFCEWGSGLGVVACLAAMLDFDACGIEIERELVDAARRLAADFDVPARFLHGSFIPDGGAALPDGEADCAWLAADRGTLEAPGLGPEDFDVIFAYPWPDEERAVAGLFERRGRAGAVLATYHGGEAVRLRRLKKPGRRGR